MKPQLKKVALAVLFALGTVNAPAALAACPLDGAKPFKAGPVNPVNGFSEWVQDSQGVALELCLSGPDAGPPCFFNPVEPNNAYSVQVGFGAEAFWWLAAGAVSTTQSKIVNVNNVPTTILTPINVGLTMAAEAAWVAEVPGLGDNFPFTRLRVVIDVPDPGVYTLNHPYGQQSWTVDRALYEATGGKRAIVEPIDIPFIPDRMNQGRVGPWLKSVNPAGGFFTFPEFPGKQFIGDGTLRPAEGSPCGTNFLRLTATALDGVTPIELDTFNEDGDGDPLTAFTDQFAVNGQMFAGQVQTPLTASGSYSRAADGSGRVNLFATAPSTAFVTANVGGNISNMTGDGSGRYFTSVAFPAGPVPAASVTADNNPPLTNNADTTTSPAVKEIVTITRAEATCTGIAPARTCSLIIEASSSDRSPGAPALTVPGLAATPLTVPVSLSGLTVVPAAVTVNSASGSFDTEPVRVINQ